MNLDKRLPLTETVYYILLALTEPAHVYAVMQKVEELIINACFIMIDITKKAAALEVQKRRI